MVNSYNRRGISTIVGGVIFLVLLTGGFSTFYIALDVQKDTINTQREISKSIVEKTLEQFEISTGTNPVDNTFEIQVENQGVNPVEITNIWIINKTSPYPANSYDVDYEDAFVPPGFSTQILENTPLSLSPGQYDIKVVSALGTIVTEKEFDPSGDGFGVFTGHILMDFTSFEFCQPVGATPDQDCTSDSSDWVTAWDGKKDTAYIWRIILANRATVDIFIEEHTALFMLRAQTQGGGNLPRVFYILNDSTTSNEGPIAYTDNSKIMPSGSVPLVLYFGVTAPGGATLETSHDSAASIAVNVLTFGHQDVINPGIYDDPGDPPYSQNMAFQAVRLS